MDVHHVSCGCVATMILVDSHSHAIVVSPRGNSVINALTHDPDVHSHDEDTHQHSCNAGYYLLSAVNSGYSNSRMITHTLSHSSWQFTSLITISHKSKLSAFSLHLITAPSTAITAILSRTAWATPTKRFDCCSLPLTRASRTTWRLSL